VLAQLLTNPAVPVTKKRGVVQALLERAGALPPVLAKLIQLIADRDRLVLLPEVARAYRERLHEHQKVVRGEVITAIALPPDRLRTLERGLAQATGRTVVLEARVDPSIVGGVITRIGSTVYDGSITTQLERMKQTLGDAGQ
jgi:F-type H+-transporting ATPase subunit delta